MALGVPKPLLENEGKDDPAGIRTRVTAVKGRCLRPLDHRATLRTLLRPEMVGVKGFEPPAPCSQSTCATRLRYTPKVSSSVLVTTDECYYMQNQ